MTDQPASDDLPVFAPVPTRHRHDGWTPERQVAFVQLLRQIGVVAAAARGVGCSVTSAHNLRRRPGAEGFAAAWDAALAEAHARAIDRAIDRALNGRVVPRYYKGKQVGAVRHYDDRFTLAVLNAAHRRPPPGR